MGGDVGLRDYAAVDEAIVERDSMPRPAAAGGYCVLGHLGPLVSAVAPEGPGRRPTGTVHRGCGKVRDVQRVLLLGRRDGV